MSLSTLKPAQDVCTAPIAALGLIGGYVTARETGIRPLGGAVLAAAGAYAGRTWLAKTGPVPTTALTLVYLGGFGASHPLAKRIGAWPAVLRRWPRRRRRPPGPWPTGDDRSH